MNTCGLCGTIFSVDPVYDDFQGTAMCPVCARDPKERLGYFHGVGNDIRENIITLQKRMRDVAEIERRIHGYLDRRDAMIAELQKDIEEYMSTFLLPSASDRDKVHAYDTLAVLLERQRALREGPANA